jgi:Type II secretion system (T2SS), protein E, N-terminal domain
MRESLGNLLVKNGVATDRDIKDAINEGQESGEPLGKVLVRKGVASESQVGKLLAEQWQLQYVEADEFEVDDVAALRISRDDAARMGAAPVAYDGNTIVMAIVEPNAELFAEVSRELGEAAYIVVSPSTFEKLTGSPPPVGPASEPSSDNDFSTEHESADEQHSDAAGSGAVVDSVEYVEVAAVGSGEPIQAALASIDEVLAKANRLHELEQMLNEVLPPLRAKLSDQHATLAAQHAALAAAEEASRRDAEKIRALESELSRQGDLFEALRGQAAALAATFEEASK